MKSIICITLLLIVLLVHSSHQCKCNDKCKKCCNSRTGEFRLVPLYELYQSKTNQYFYTVSLREVNEAVKIRGYIRKGVIGLVAVSSTDCKKEKSLVAVRRHVDKESSDYLYQTEKDGDHDGKNSRYTLEGIAFYGADTEQHCGATIPLYRFWDGKNHIYTTDIADGKERAGKNGKNEGLICYIWPSPNTTTTTTSTTTTTTTTTTRDPLDNPGSCSMALTKIFRLYRASTDSFLFTSSYDEAKNAYEKLNYNPQPSPGYAAPEKPSCRCNLIPAYRLDRAEPKEDHFFTTDKKEADDAVSQLGYTNAGISFYCAEKARDCGASVAYYRYKRNNAIKNHFFTTDTNEESATKSTQEGLLCYIWPEQN